MWCADTDHGHWPFYDSGFHILKSFEGQLFFNRCFCHGKLIMSTLEMIMAQDRSSNNRKIRIRSDKVMWELLYKIQKFSKGCFLDFHRCMLCIKNDAVLIVVNIWRILEEPVTVIDRYRNNPVVLSCRMVHTSCISLILFAEKAFRITALFCKLGCRDRLWIFFRFGEVDGDIQCSKLGICSPFLVFFDTISTNVVCIPA